MVGLKKEITEMQEVNRELRDELEQLQPTSNKFMEGNAIFTDVEEQRVALERELITLKVKVIIKEISFLAFHKRINLF